MSIAVVVIIIIISVRRQLSSCNGNPSNPKVPWCVRSSCCGWELFLCRRSGSKCGRGWRAAGSTGAGAVVPAAIAISNRQSVNRIPEPPPQHQKKHAL